MKKLLIVFLGLLVLSGCRTPDYGYDQDLSETFETSDGTEVATYNGYVVEVTEDNMIRIKVPKRGEMIQKGWTVNEEGIIKVALASVKLPTADLPLSEETNAALKNVLLDKEITLYVLDKNISPASLKNKSLNELSGYIHLKDKDSTIQEVLIENGLAIIDKSSPFVNSYMSDLEKLQTAAKNNSLGVWALDGFVSLSNSFEGHFTNFLDVNEAEIKSIIQDIKAKGLDLENIIKK